MSDVLKLLTPKLARKTERLPRLGRGVDKGIRKTDRCMSRRERVNRMGRKNLKQTLMRHTHVPGNLLRRQRPRILGKELSPQGSRVRGRGWRRGQGVAPRKVKRGTSRSSPVCGCEDGTRETNSCNGLVNIGASGGGDDDAGESYGL